MFPSKKKHRSRRPGISLERSLLVRPQVEQLESRLTPANFVVTNGLDSGAGSLRDAITQANNEAINPGLDHIWFDSSMGNKAVELSSSSNEAGPTALVITSTIIITGLPGDAGVTIARDSSQPLFRLFTVTSTGSLTLENLTLRGGQAKGGDGGSGVNLTGTGGGGAGLGGAVLNFGGSLWAYGCTFAYSSAVGGSGGKAGSLYTGAGTGGGGLGGDGLTSWPYSGGGPNGGKDPGNDGGFGGGGAGVYGARDASGPNAGNGGFGGGGGGAGKVELGVVGGTAGRGGNGGFGGGGGGGGQGSGFGGDGAGGIEGFGGGVASTPSSGGNFGQGGGGAGMGGAIFNLGGSVQINNSTFYNNVVRGGASQYVWGAGQGLGAAIFSLNGTLAITNSTLDTNSATWGGAVFSLADPGIQVGTPGRAGVLINNSILTGSVNPSGARTLDLDIYARGSTQVGGTSDLVGLANDSYYQRMPLYGRDPRLGPFEKNGGPTSTLVPKFDSPALDAGNSAAAAGAGLASDQRGGPRLFGASVDVGAVEVSANSYPPIFTSLPQTQLNVFPLNTLRFTFAAVDADPGQRLTFSLVGAPAGASIDPVTGQFTWTPTPDQGGQLYDFQVRVSDNGYPVKFDQRFIFVSVQAGGPAANTAPVLTYFPFFTIDSPGKTLTFTATATDADVPKQKLTFSLFRAPTGARIDPVTGVFTWTPTPAQLQASREWEFSVIVVDDGKPFKVAEKLTWVYTPGGAPQSKGDAGSETTAFMPPPLDEYVAQAFLDLNGNGLRDANEPGLPGRTFYLDVDGNGELGPTEPHWATDAEGAAVLEGIPPEEWMIRYVSLPGEAVSTPTSYEVTGDWSGMEMNLGIRPTANESFVAALYRDLLHRPVDPGGLATWSNALDGGMTPDQLVLAIQTDPGHEYYGVVVHDLYETFLGRAPQAADNPEQYVDLLAKGTTQEQVAVLFAASDEFFQQQGGGGNGGFVNALYLAAFRTPDRLTSDAGAVHWQQQLENATLSRSQLAAIVFASAEYRQAVIQNDYRAFFGRDADISGIAYWSRQLANGATDQQVLAAMLGDWGKEYFNRAL
jgi:hypothetical protein